jgi:hypothetical protein
LPKKTLAIARSGGADVLVQVKENQPELLAMCQMLAQYQNPSQQHVDHDKGHGRIETRMIDTFIPPSAWLPQGWQPLVQAVVKVVRTASIALSCMRASDEPCIFTGRLQKYSQLRSRGLCCAPENLTALCRGVGTPQPTPHERHLQTFQTQGRPARPASIGYGRRALVEIAMNKSRYKALIGTRLRARKLPAQRIETTIGVAVLNRILDAARPKFVRYKAQPA